jgi:hypothetical protein
MLGIHVVTTASTFTVVPTGQDLVATSFTAARLQAEPSMAKSTFIGLLLILTVKGAK